MLSRPTAFLPGIAIDIERAEWDDLLLKRASTRSFRTFVVEFGERFFDELDRIDIPRSIGCHLATCSPRHVFRPVSCRFIDNIVMCEACKNIVLEELSVYVRSLVCLFKLSRMFVEKYSSEARYGIHFTLWMGKAGSCSVAVSCEIVFLGQGKLLYVVWERNDLSTWCNC